MPLLMLLSLSGSSGPAEARARVGMSRGCRVTATTATPLRTEAGLRVHVDPQATGGSESALMVLGDPVLMYDRSGALIRDRTTRHYVGALVRGDTARLIDPPRGDTALLAPLVSYDGKHIWDVVWPRPVRPGEILARTTLFDAAYDGQSWGTAERIGALEGVLWGPGLNSAISRNGDSIAFAVPLANSNGAGSIAVVTRYHERWHVRMLSTETGAGAGYATLQMGPRGLIVAYISGGLRTKGGSNALFVKRSSRDEETWSRSSEIVDSGAFEPQLVTLGRSNLLLVWRQTLSVAGSPGVWFARSHDGGESWDLPRPLIAAVGVDPNVALVAVNEASALALVELGGPFRREMRLAEINSRGVDNAFSDSVNAATRVLLTQVGATRFRAIWSRVRPGSGLLPESVERTFTVVCSGAELDRPTYHQSGGVP